MTTFTFDNFNYIDTDITFPKDIVFFRGIVGHVNVIREEFPLYIAPENIAKDYGQVYKLVTTKPIKLIDIRKLKNIIELIISSRILNDESILKPIRYLTISFGLCSYDSQIRLLNEYIEQIEDLVVDKNELISVKNNIETMKKTNVRTILNPLEPEGVRVAETFIDSKSMMILRALFEGIYDGFISPKMFSPFHKNNMTHEEIVIFNPKLSGIKVLSQHTEKIHITSLNKVLDVNYKSYTLKNNIFESKVYTKHKGGSPLIDQYKYYKNKDFMKETIKEAKVFVKNIRFKKYKYDKPQLLLPDTFDLPPPTLYKDKFILNN